MARHFSELDRQIITDKLREAGLALFIERGIRAVPVSALCASADIAKGSFYNFYTSKEDLFMDIGEVRSEEHRQSMLNLAADHKGTSAEFVDAFFELLLNGVETDSVMEVILRPGEMDHLLRHLSPERMAAHQADDSLFFQELSPVWTARGLITDVDPNTINQLILLMICLVTRREIPSETDYQGAVSHLRHLFQSKLTKVDP